MLVLQFSIALISLLIWVYLLAFRGQFWRTDQRLESQVRQLVDWPKVAIIIPARNEADLVETVLSSLLEQNYAGDFKIYLVDDNSHDDTATIAEKTAYRLGYADRVKIIAAQPLPNGWTGKLWALHQGVEIASQDDLPDYFLLTDADIRHDQSNLQNLVAKAINEHRDLVSLMVRLRCQSVWEQLLIPAFVFFFAKLYPFRWVNQSNCSIAAAAGGCSLVKRSAIVEIGGIAALKDALIDDCTLAMKVKRRSFELSSDTQPTNRYHSIWLGLTSSTDSLRPYDSLSSIWQMVARTAYTQLNYSPWLLIGTIFGMYLVYLAAPIGIITAAISHQLVPLCISILTYSLMTIAYLPINRFYKTPMVYVFCLPLIGLLYSLMTIDSARQHWQGKGGKWKGRSY
jgi:hopene-associated glycosyltransferase HpnB